MEQLRKNEIQKLYYKLRERSFNETRKFKENQEEFTKQELDYLINLVDY